MGMARQARGARTAGRGRFMLVGALAGLLNTSFALATVLPGEFVSASAAISELSVPGQPWSWVFRAGDGSSALLLLAVAAAGLRRAPAGPRRAGLVLVAFSAAMTLISALVPLTCAPDATRCADPTPLADRVHDAVSVVGTTAALLAAGALVVATRGGTRVAHALAALTASGLGIGLVVAASAAPTASWFGPVQQAQVVVLSVWFAVVGRSVDDSGSPAPSAGA